MSFNRTCIVEFVSPAGDKQLKGIDVKFKIDLPMSAVLAKADISICNLTRADIEYLTTYTYLWAALTQKKRIRLFAGYSDTQTNLLFDGDIIEAIPTQPPDIWLDCKAQSGNYGSTQVYLLSVFDAVPIKTLFEQAAVKLGLTLEWRSKSTKQVKDFNFNGNYQKMIEQLTKLDNITVFEETGSLIVVDNAAPVRDGAIREISEITGMIGVPKIDAIGIEATLLLDTTIKRGDTVHLSSIRVPAANGNYYVYNICHEGHLRGTNWYTTIKARRLDVYGRELKLTS